MARRSVSGRPCLNTATGKKSYLVLLSDTANDYSERTRVKVVDGTHDLEWAGDPHQVAQTGKRLKVKLKSVRGHDRDKKKKDFDEPPDTGTVTVTITTPADTVPGVNVDYITDDT